MISVMTDLSRSSNWPRYLVPATREAMSSVTTRLFSSVWGTFPSTIRWAKPSTMAFCHARLADQYRVVFLATGQNLCHPLDFVLAPDDRVEPSARAISVRSRPK